MVKKKKARSINPLIVPWIVFGVLMVLTAGLLLPTKVVSYQVETPYIEKENYTVEVPYETVEPYVVQVPYETKEQYVESVPTQQLAQEQSKENIKYSYSWDKCTLSGWLSSGQSTLRISNLDTEAATFSIKIGYNDNSGQFISTVVSKSIGASASDVFTYTPTPSSFSGCNWAWVSGVPTKIVYKEVTKTVYEDVIKERTITKTRDETQYKEVTKTRTETREREVRKVRTETMQKEVNWIFGFDAVIKFRSLN